MDDRILEAIERECARVRQETKRRIREAEAWESDELTRYERVRCALRAEVEPIASESPKPTPTRRRRGVNGRVHRKRLPPASSEELKERRDKVARLIEESGEPPALGEISRVLALSPHRVKIAIHGLIEEGRIEAVGRGSATRYVPAKPASGPLSRQAPTQGTLEERIVVVLEDRHQATGEELAQALRAPLKDLAAACGRLQGEERIRMSRINDRPVYVLAVRI